jgi:hypothetical protein
MVKNVLRHSYPPRELQAQILAPDIAQNTAGTISVTNPPPGGGNSSASWAQVEVHTPISQIALNPKKAYPVGVYLTLAADFNNDGILDLAGEYGDDIVFYPGKGDGGFHFESIAGRYYSGNGGAYGDFNGDGNLDFAYGQVPNGNQNAVADVMLGDGHGKFKFGSGFSYTYDTSLSVGLIAAGDFNGDGKLDLILTDSQGFAVYLGNGDGTFHHFTDVVDSTYGGQEIMVGDFNGDGKLDVLVFINPGGGTQVRTFISSRAKAMAPSGRNRRSFPPRRFLGKYRGLLISTGMANLILFFTL